MPDANPRFTADEIRALREREQVSQAVFANHLNVSKDAVSQWERGAKHPAGPSLKLLSLVKKNGPAHPQQPHKDRRSNSNAFLAWPASRLLNATHNPPCLDGAMDANIIYPQIGYLPWVFHPSPIHQNVDFIKGRKPKAG